MAPRQSGLGDRGRAQVRSNFADIGRTPGKDNPDLYLRRPHVADMLDEFKSLVNGSGMSPDEAFLTLQEKYPLNAPDDFAALRTYINDIGAEGDPVGRPRTFTDARRAADPAIQSDAEAARIKNRVVRLRDTPEADLIPGQTADDAARLADRARAQHASTFGKPSSAPAESWTDRVMNQSGKPVPDAPPPMPRPAPASSPLAARARDLTSGAELVGPGELDDPLTMSSDGPAGTGGPRTPAREAQLAGRTYEGPGTPPPYRPEGTDPTKGGRAAADAARKARLNGEPDLPTVEAEGSRAQARVARELRGGPVEDTVDALYERRNVPGTLRPGAVGTDELAGMGDDLQNIFRQWVVDPSLDTGKLPAAQRAALTELQARTLSLTPANASLAEFTDAVNAVGSRTFGGASWNPVTPRYDTLSQTQLHELYRPRPEYNPGGPRSIRANAVNVDDVAMLDRMAAERTTQAAALGKPASFAEVLSGWDAGTPPHYAGTPPPYFNPGTPPPYAGTPPPYAGTPPPYSPPAAAAAFDAGTPPPYYNPGTPPPYSPPVAQLGTPATPASSVPAAAVPGPPRANLNVPAPSAQPGPLGTPPASLPAAPEITPAVEQAVARPRGMAGVKALFGRGAAGEGAAAAEGAAANAGKAGLFGASKGLLGGAVKSFGVPLAVGAAASAGGHALGERLTAGQTDTSRPFEQADVGQFFSGVGDAALPMAGIAPLAAAALGAGPIGWTALGIGALGAGAYGLGKAIWGGGTGTDAKNDLLSDPTISADDRSYFEGVYDRALAAGASEDEALAATSQQMDQYLASERERRRQEAEQMRYQVTPSQLMTLQTLQMKDMNDLTDQQRLANAAYMQEAQRFAGMPGTNPALASLALQNANMFNAHAANQAIAYRQAYQMAPLRDMFQTQLDSANRVQNSVASRTASAYAQQLSGLGGGGASSQPDLAALLAQQQQAAPAYG